MYFLNRKKTTTIHNKIRKVLVTKNPNLQDITISP